ncbi:MAG TPA: hypothetical protein VJ787_11315, partial [Thermoleophilia bacterium]|nr:hypothetical protein [Thermoleophilia bacterium]
PVAGITGLLLLLQATGVVGWDAAAHLYKIALLRDHRSIIWDNSWYGGAYSIISYGVVFYYLAQFVSYTLLVGVSTGLLPLFFYLYFRRVYGVESYVPSIVLAVVLALYLANGQDPFLFAMSFVMLGMVLVAYDRPLLAALPLAVALFANPLAIVVAAIFLSADFIARPERRRLYLRLALYMAPFAAAKAVLMVLFAEASSYVYYAPQVLLFAGFGLSGFAMARMSRDPERRAKEVLFLTFTAVAVATVLVPGNPLGGNVGRIFFLFGVPLLLSVRRVYLPKFLVVPIIVGFAVGQVAAPARHYVHVADLPSTKAPFFAPALQFAGTHYDPNFRFHVVALDTHWEAYYFSINDYLITRGWYRQQDAVHNDIFATKTFTAGQYVAWLRAMGAKYVFLPKAPLDISGAREARLLATTPAFTAVYDGPQWTVYRLAGPQPIAVPARPGDSIKVVYVDHGSVFFDVGRPGTYLVKISYSPYWQVTNGLGTLSESQDGFVLLHAQERGFYGMRVQVDLQSLGQVVEERLALRSPGE